MYFNFIGNYRMPEVEMTEEEIAEQKRSEVIKDKRHKQYFARKARGKQKAYEKRYEPTRKARVAKLKAENSNTHGIPAEE